MTAPTCSTCRWWEAPDYPDASGLCEKFSGIPVRDDKAYVSRSGVSFCTRSTFGCNQHEPAELQACFDTCADE